jgi:hypothetical protein
MWLNQNLRQREAQGELEEGEISKVDDEKNVLYIGFVAGL